MTEPKKDLPGAMPEAQPATGGVQDAVEPKAEPVTGEEKGEDPERLLTTVRKLREELKAAKADSKRLADLEAEEAKRKEAELTEMQKLQKRLEETELKLADAARRDLLRRVADEVGLPGELATRLQGKDEDELRADAKKLLDYIKAPPKPKIEPTLPAAGQKPETNDEKRRRILNPYQSDVFSIEGAKKMGGGVIYTDK